MPIALSVLKYVPPVNPDRVFLKATFSGNYTAGVNGDTLNLNPSTYADPVGAGVLPFPDQPPAVVPAVDSVNYTGAAGSGAGAIGSSAVVIPGATLATYKLQQFVPGGTELPSGPYPAGITGGYLELEVLF